MLSMIFQVEKKGAITFFFLVKAEFRNSKGTGQEQRQKGTEDGANVR